MHSKHFVKWMALVVVLVSMSVAAIPGTADAPQGVDPEAISCGDSATCSMSGTALYVQNTGSGTAIYGNSMANGIGVRAKGSPGVYGYSYHGTGVRGKSENGYGVKAQSNANYALYADSTGYGGGYLRSAGNADPDLVLGGNSGSSDDGTISSEPADVDSDIILYSNDRVHIHLDEDNNGTTEEFRIVDGANDALLDLDADGHLGIMGNVYLATDGGIGSVRSTAAGNSSLHVASNSYINVYVDNDNNFPNTCFNILDGDGQVIWQQCEARGSTTVGTQAVAVETNSGSREMYAVGSPGNWFEDFGRAALVDGQATVSIDPLFAETVNLEVEYQVYLTPVSSEAVLLFVTAKGPTAFTVQGVTLDGSPASAGFDYRIVAKRLGYESQRLAEVDLAPEEDGER